jgi:hypothetical protein
VAELVGAFTKGELLASLDLQREKFLLLTAAARSLAPTEALAREIEKGARRDLIASAHELLTEYCIAGGQSAAHAAQPWYQFARVLRNSVVHYRGEFVSRWPPALRARGVAELRWRHLVLRDRVGEVVRVTNDDALALWREARDFAERGLR